MARACLRAGWLWLWLLAARAAAPDGKGGAGHGLDVLLEAAWPSHRLWALLEAGEFLGGERVWALVERAVSPAVAARLSGASSSEEARAASEAAALPLLPEADVLGRRLLQLSLDLRAFAPAVEQQRQLCNAMWERVGGGAPGAPPPLAWAAVGVVGGAHRSVATSPASLVAALAAARAHGGSGGAFAAANGDAGLDLLRPLGSDHVFASASGSRVVAGRVVAVLHGVPGSGEFAALHGALRDAALAEPASLTYVLRWCPSAADPLVSERTKLAGFGASMDIKNMEYLTVDTDKQREKDAGPGGSAEATPEEEPQSGDGGDGGSAQQQSNEVVQLSARELANLGLQAAQRIMASAEPLRTWADLACNLPSRAKQQLVGTRVLMDLMRAARRLDDQRAELPAAGSILVNGVSVDAASESFNVFELVRSLREDAEMSAAAAAIELPGACAGAGGPSGELVAGLADQFAASGALDGGLAETEDQDALALSVVRQAGPRVDVKAGAKGAVVFFNDVEKDAMYARWPRDLDALLQPVQRLIPVRKNLFTVIAVADPARTEDRAALNLLVQLVQQGAPMRLGVVFDEAERQSAGRARLANGECRADCFVALFLEAIDVAGKEAGVKLLGALLHASGVPGPLSLSFAVDEFARALGKAGGEGGAQRLRERALAAAQARKGADSSLAAMSRYVASKGLPVPSWTLNGLVKRASGAAALQQELIQALMTEQRVVQYQVHFGKITDDTNVLSYLLDAAAALPRYNVAIVRPISESLFLAPASAGSRALLLKEVPYLFRGGPGEAPVTIWLMVGSERGAAAEAAAAALDAAEQTPDGVRLAVLPRSPAALEALPGAFWRAVAAASSAAELRIALAPAGAAAASSSEELARLASLGARLGLGPGGEDGLGSALVVNGRVIELGNAPLVAADIELAVAYERQLRAEAVRSALAGCEGASVDDVGDAAVELTAHAGRRSKRQRRALPSYLFDNAFAPLWLDTGAAAAAAGTAEADADADAAAAAGAAVDVTAVMDPLGEAAPRVSAVLSLLHEALGARVRVLLTPVLGLVKFPIATYFRFVGRGGAARFQAMPQEQLLTLKISTPEPWIVYPADTGGLDTDNVRLGALTKSAKVKFDLASLLVTGHCEEVGAPSPPAGLQLQLSSALGPRAEVRSDTLVMRNLGYLQLQAGPGVWRLATAPGASSELYEILPGTSDGGEGQGQQSAQQQQALAKGEKLIVIRDFCGQVERLETRKRPGREKEQLLDSLEEAAKGGGGGGGEAATPQRKSAAAQEAPKSVWEALQGALKEIVYGGAPPAPANPNETIHVFSLASGALYERFLMLMCKTVTKASSQPIKVWIIENFLSPEFKRNIPVLAQHYGFSYALVTYKWPHWLRRQTEKQRIIWGYKILFLDVLFPLDVPKIIYIDSDQVVRADVAELWRMNLRGRPYAYTPFCDSRKETLGFQFWRQGFWQSHLQGAPYHISALYVVDLVRFRKFMVGDRLRAIYDNLSRDPGSLANLDQDLPNYAQHVIPIHSLPQEWLWCESWCSDESKARSKTIDLCNNPLHKEPKLDMAKRVISGPLFPQSWIEMDDEIKAVVAAAAAKADAAKLAAAAGKPPPQTQQQHAPPQHAQDRTEL